MDDAPQQQVSRTLSLSVNYAHAFWNRLHLVFVRFVCVFISLVFSASCKYTRISILSDSIVPDRRSIQKKKSCFEFGVWMTLNKKKWVSCSTTVKQMKPVFTWAFFFRVIFVCVCIWMKSIVTKQHGTNTVNNWIRCCFYLFLSFYLCPSVLLARRKYLPFLFMHNDTCNTNCWQSVRITASPLFFIFMFTFRYSLSECLEMKTKMEYKKTKTT